MTHIFSGLKVIDCATVIAAPTAAMMLGDVADVIKIEQPGDGDMLRMLSHVATTPEKPAMIGFATDGRNKRGLCLTLNILTVWLYCTA